RSSISSPALQRQHYSQSSFWGWTHQLAVGLFSIVVVPFGLASLAAPATTSSESLVSSVWPRVVAQSSAANLRGSSDRCSHHRFSLPVRCSSSWCVEQSGTVNSSLTFVRRPWD